MEAVVSRPTAHRVFLLLLLVAAPSIVAFAQQDVISLLDDSASYLTLARRGEFSGYLSNFPPVLPLVFGLGVFVVREVDRAALDRFIATTGSDP